MDDFCSAFDSREVYDEAYKKQTEIAPQHTEDILIQGRQTAFVVKTDRYVC